ncbi:MAG: hypothetical protein NC935_05685, partial [Candidatus Omnitrophica bacterium]|nr:hypothetical protein [Candidatus Omnitrophota bacterium]
MKSNKIIKDSLFKNKKIIYSFIIWLFSIGLFDVIFLLKKDNQSTTNAEFLFLGITIIAGIISFLVFILTLGKIFYQKYQSVKASVLSTFSFIFFIIFGHVLVYVPFNILGFYKNPQIIKPTQASKNTLIFSGLKLGSTGEDVKVLQSA